MTKRTPQLLLGLLLVAIGGTALLGRLGVVDIDLGELVSTWWPMLIVLVGIAALVSVPRAWVGPAIIILVGAVLQFDRLDLIAVSFWDVFWPSVLLLIGLVLVARYARGPADDRNTINSTVMWWGSNPRTTSQDFKGGSLTAVMGGIEADLRAAGIQGRAEVSAFVFWAGIEIKVPPTWRVTVRGLPILGGWEDKTVVPLDPNAPELIVHVTAIMGGVDIKN